MSDIPIPNGVEVEYTLNKDDPNRVWLNVYHFRVVPSMRGQGLASEAIANLTHSASENDEIDVITITMQAPVENQEEIQYLFTEKFSYDELRGPYEHEKYDSPLIEAEKQV